MSEVKIKPLGKRILVKPQEQEEKTVSGLYIPQSSSEDKKATVGTVIKLGTAPKEKFQMKEGDKVVFKKYSPEELDVNGEKYLVMDIDDVLAVIA